MRNTEKVRRSTASNLLVQYPLAELTLQLAVDPNKSRRQEPMVDPDKSRRLFPTEPRPLLLQHGVAPRPETRRAAAGSPVVLPHELLMIMRRRRLLLRAATVVVG
jgi:hypothetical protein